MARLVIFDFDGTLFNTHDTILDAIKQTFNKLSPGNCPSPEEIEFALTSGVAVGETMRGMQPDPSTFDEDLWVTTYRQLCNEGDASLIQTFPGAKELLSHLKTQGIFTAIVSNKSATTIKNVLRAHGMSELIPDELIVGDDTPGAKKKPDPGSFWNVLVPRLREMEGGDEVVEKRRVLMVGDTTADIAFARNIGGKISWCRYGHGSREECEGMQPDWSIDNLGEVAGFVELI